MTNWLHRLLNPHCPQCAQDDSIRLELQREMQVCQSCETLKQQLAFANEQIKELHDLFLEKNKVVEEPVRSEKQEPIKPLFVPWRIKQQTLEAEDRVKRQLLDEEKKKSQVTPELEKSIKELEDALDLKVGLPDEELGNANNA